MGSAMDALALAPSEHAFLEALNRLGGVRKVQAEGLTLPLLPLARILVSKRAANRPKDQAQIPALEAALAVEQDENEKGS